MPESEVQIPVVKHAMHRCHATPPDFYSFGYYVDVIIPDHSEKFCGGRTPQG